MELVRPDGLICSNCGVNKSEIERRVAEAAAFAAEQADTALAATIQLGRLAIAADRLLREPFSPAAQKMVRAVLATEPAGAKLLEDLKQRLLVAEENQGEQP